MDEREALMDPFQEVVSIWTYDTITFCKNLHRYLYPTIYWPTLAIHWPTGNDRGGQFRNLTSVACTLGEVVEKGNDEHSIDWPVLVEIKH